MNTKQYKSDKLEGREALKRLREVVRAFGHRSQDGDDVTALAEYISSMRDSEKKRVIYTKSSPQKGFRKGLVQMMMSMGGEQKMSYDTVYLAIYLLDRFMDHHDIQRKTLPYVAVVCLVVSGKLLGCDHVHLYRDFCKYLVNQTAVDCRRQNLVALESYILNALGFRILVPTEINFLDIYLLYAIDGLTAHEAELQNNNSGSMPNANYPNVEVKPPTSEATTYGSHVSKLTDIYETAFHALQLIVLAGPVTTHPPSLVAAAILMAARREYCLNFWTPTLRRVTSYSLADVRDCLQEAVEPHIRRMKLSQPFDPPEFLNVPNLPNLVETVMRIV